MSILDRPRAAIAGLLRRLRRGGRRAAPHLFHDRLVSWLAVFHPDVHLVAMASPSHTVLRVDRQEVQVDLQGLHDWFQVEPERLGEVLDHYIADLVQELRERPLPPLDAVLDHLYPQIRPFAFLKENSPRFGRGRLVRLPFPRPDAPAPTSELRILYAIDEGQALTFVNQGHLEAWRLAPQSLHNLSLRNLARLGRGLAPDGSLETADGLAASHVLLLPRLLPGRELLAAIPHRDLLLTAPADLSGPALAAFAARVARAHSSAPRKVLGTYLHFAPDALVSVPD